jgi:hypothetical protein
MNSFWKISLISLFFALGLSYAASSTQLSAFAQALVHISVTLGCLLLFDFCKGDADGGRESAGAILDLSAQIRGLADTQKKLALQVQDLYLAAREAPQLERLKDELEAAKEISNNYARDLKKAHEDALDAERRLSDSQRDLDARLKTISELQRKLAEGQIELAALIKAKEQRLSRIFPAELLSSEVGESVRWSAEAATQQDFIATAIFASLQSLFASQIDPEASEQSLDCLRTLGRALSKMARREGWSSARRHEMFSAWARVLNGLSGNHFTLYVPDIGARVRNDTMTGLHDGTVMEVHCWGVRNHKQGIAYLAEVG